MSRLLIASYPSKDFLQNQETFNEGDVILYCLRLDSSLPVSQETAA